ncbi:hypothetical protein CNR22_15325 [Sphingobacteriaceae bacterium]|nr:hypothetical protein CNR22_15325 [Sphingobacteriaceae bacterium]
MKKPFQWSKLLFLSLSFFLIHYAEAQQSCQGSLLFNQTNDISVKLPATNHYYTAVNGGYTWECWIKLNSVPGSTNNDRQIISSIDGTLYEDMYLGFGWHGGVQNRGYDSLVFKVDPPSAAVPVDLNCAWKPSGGFLINTWYHVAGVADYGAGMKYLYVNCVLVNSQSLTVAPNTRVIPTNLSSHNGGNGLNSLNGYMDEVRIWDKPLSPLEISANCNQCLNGTEANLFLYYRLNQTGALSVLDATSNFNNASFLNAPSPAWSTQNAPVSGTACQEACKCLGSLDFDTRNNPSVALPLTNQYYYDVTSTGYTWETWFKLKSAPGSTSNDLPLISAIDNASFRDLYLGFGWHSGFFNRGYDSLVFKVDPPSGVPVDLNCAWKPAGGFLTNRWYHAAGVADYLAGRKYLYVDGVLVDTQLLTVAPIPNVIQTNLSACGACPGVNSIDGKMDEVRIWKKALAPIDIASNYQKCRLGTESDLVLYYRCNQVGASTVIDGSVNGFTGSFVNLAGWSSENAPVTGTCRKDCNRGEEAPHNLSSVKTLGIEKTGRVDGSLVIYPNPSSGSIKVSSEHPGVLTVYALTGQILSEINVQKNEQEVKLEGYKAGIYLYVFTSDSGTSSGKLVIEN